MPKVMKPRTNKSRPFNGKALRILYSVAEKRPIKRGSTKKP